MVSLPTKQRSCIVDEISPVRRPFDFTPHSVTGGHAGCNVRGATCWPAGCADVVGHDGITGTLSGLFNPSRASTEWVLSGRSSQSF